MPNIKLPDGKSLNFKDKVTGFKIAEKISKSLSKEALIISVDGNFKDLNYEKSDNCNKLLDICFKNKLIEDYWKNNMSAIRSLLEGGIPTARNKLSAHGQGEIPIQVPGFERGVTDISNSHLHACAIKDDGAYCWGRGVNGELGNGEKSNSNNPVSVAIHAADILHLCLLGWPRLSEHLASESLLQVLMLALLQTESPEIGAAVCYRCWLMCEPAVVPPYASRFCVFGD